MIATEQENQNEVVGGLQERSRKFGWSKRKEDGKYKEEENEVGKRLRMWKEKQRDPHLPFSIVFLRLLLQEIVQLSDLSLAFSW